ncbi:exodeoxyribonuclease VII small subunit [Paucilactobacillus nenjiangensis]|jgi:exodeoxyribonuclease VII small subunit|uniref:Exodeoxyribonuclease 7 small subunit n=1 Tax=Paucilactobacillus nenjiangensis TaxID=1296540 RepID=A0A5P1X0C4_9LACO|nr:exodeoxyribonuclease VII small subunit [Paucilactobacillus nenjiangensis]QER67342.1 exodeoxyribonuclease VII small subunit [Paucilactobacillus nenjiangensis]
MAEKVSFEEQLEKLQTIVSQLEQGDVPLEKALTQFQDGVKLSKQLQDTLDNAEKTLTKLMDDNNQEINFDADPKEE